MGLLTMTKAQELRALLEFVNVAACCVPCESVETNCRLNVAARKALPALNSVVHRLQVEVLCHPEPLRSLPAV